MEIRQAGEPWHVLGEEASGTGTARYVDSSLERVQVKVNGYASTRHARLGLQGGDWFLEDLGSTNGTYLDRAKVTGPTRVPLGVPIRIGKTVIELRS